MEWPFSRRRMTQAQKPCPLMFPRHPVYQSWPCRGEVQSSWGGKKILLPLQPVVTAGEISQPLRALRLRGGPIQFPRLDHQSLQPPTRDSHPIQTLLTSMGLSVVQPMTPLCRFAGLTACLQTQEPSEMASKAPHNALPIGMVATPRISTISMSHII